MKEALINRKWLTLALVLFSAGTGIAQQKERDLIEMRIGLVRNGFTNVNQTDAKAALKVCAQSLGTKKGYEMNVTVLTFDSEDQLAQAVYEASLNLVVIQARYYLKNGLESLLDPICLPTESKQSQGPHEYLLLVREDSSYKTLSDLKDQEILLMKSITCELSKFWIETLLMEESNEPFDHFFSSSRNAHKPSDVILPVFFGTTEACVVHRPAFDIMIELNPQLGRQLRAIAVSKPLVDALVCMPKKDPSISLYRKDIIDTMTAINEDIYGKQILTLFKTEGMIRFKEEHLIETRALVEQHYRLIEKGEIQ